MKKRLTLLPTMRNLAETKHLKKGDKTKAISFFNQFKGGNSYQQMTSTEKDKLEDYIL